MPTLAQNKKARFDYTILDRYEAGLVLTGPEVKSVRDGGMNLTGAFITFTKDEAWLTNGYIKPYTYAAAKEDYIPDRSRKLLLNRKEIAYLQGKRQEAGLTIVPLSVYTKGRRIKIDIAVAKGKKTHDKRESIKKRTLNRELDRYKKAH